MGTPYFAQQKPAAGVHSVFRREETRNSATIPDNLEFPAGKRTVYKNGALRRDPAPHICSSTCAFLKGGFLQHAALQWHFFTTWAHLTLLSKSKQQVYTVCFVERKRAIAPRFQTTPSSCQENIVCTQTVHVVET